MKKLLLFFILILAAACGNAQTNGRGTGMPAYRILTTDSTYATPANLKKHRRVMLIYFSPDCPHCQHLTMDIRERMKDFGDTQIVMITWSANYDIRAIKNFVRDFNLKKYHNIVVGTEGYTNFVMQYFKVTTTPYIAVYNSNKQLVKAFDKSPDINLLIKTVKNANTTKPVAVSKTAFKALKNPGR